MNTQQNIRYLYKKLNDVGKEFHMLKQYVKNNSGGEEGMLEKVTTSTEGVNIVLTGDGTTGNPLKANYTVNFGTTANTIAQGNDTRFHAHTNKAVLDSTTASFTTALKTKLDGLSNYTLTKTAVETALGFTPIANTHAVNGITSTNITNWNSAFSWGNHADAGYLKTIKTINGESVVGVGDIIIPTNADFSSYQSTINEQVENLSQNVVSLATPTTLVSILEGSTTEEVDKLKTLLGIV